MQHLERDRRGYPIPFVVYRDKDDRPHFTINDEYKRQQVIRNDLCSICGQKLHRGRWSVGGPKSAFDKNGAYIDTPMHHECLTYALRTCPYLAMPSYVKRIDDRTLRDTNGLVLLDQTVDDQRPVFFVAVMHVHQHHIMNQGGLVEYIFPIKIRQYEFWRNGEQINTQVAYDLWCEHYSDSDVKWMGK